MPSLAELTDTYPQQDNSLPVAQPYTGANLGPLQAPTNAAIGNTAAVVPSTDAVAQADPNSVGSSGSQIIDKLLGLDGQERYQLWPEKVIRDALAAPHDALAGTMPQYSVDPSTGDVHTSPQMIAGAQAVSALAGSGGLGGIEEGAGSALGSAPFLRPALKYDGKIYKAPMGGQHLDALPAHLADTFQKQAMSGEDISNFNFGFMNHKGQFLDREKALDYGIKEGLIDPSAGQYGALTSTLLADSSKPGTAIEAMAKTTPFYSALEHNVNATSQSKMTGDQWLGTLANKPGVKPEELDWTGVKSFLEERGKEPVTKAELQEHLQNNKVELKEVDKTDKTAITDPTIKYLSESFEAPHIKTAKDIEDARKFNSHFRETTKGMSDQEVFDAIEKSNQFRNDPTKYHSYQLPGGTSYREKLLTLPNYMKQYNEFVEGLGQKYGARVPFSKMPLTEVEKSRLDFLQEHGEDPTYKSSHWDEPNILAHVRMNDRMIDGKKSLGINEAQSDWHQSGRKAGYQNPQSKASEEEISKLVKADSEARAANHAANEKAWLEATNGKAKNQREFTDTGIDRHELRRAQDYVVSHKESAASYDKTIETQRALNEAVERGKTGVPDAPFKKTWHELVLKRMIREAAEKGYDNLHFPGSPETVAKVEGWSNFKTKTVDGKPRYFTGDQDVTPIVDRYLVDFPRFLNKIGKEHKVKVEQHNFNIREKGAAPSDFSQGVLSNMDLPQSLKDVALNKGFPLFSNKYMFTPVQGDPFSDKK